MFLPRAAVLAGILGLSLSCILIPSDAATAATFAITTPEGTLFPSSSVTITGAKDAASVVEIPSLTGGDPYCQVPGVGDPQTENWSCTFTLPDGAWPVKVTETIGATTTTHVVNIRVLGAPTIKGNDPLLTTGIISGSGFVGAGIRIIGSGPQDPSGDCTTVQAGGLWSCPLPVTKSGDYLISVQQTWQGAAGGISAQRSVTVDKVPPGLPMISQPAAGDRIAANSATFVGGGENASRVDVFADGVLACSTFVTQGQWSCAASGLPSGEHTIQAIQWDAAGNASGATSGFTVTFGYVAVVPPGPAAPAAPSTPATPPPPASAPGPTASYTPPPTFPHLPPPIGGSSGRAPGDTWGTPTGYGAAIPSLAMTATSGTWLWGALIAIAFIAGVALPARLMLNTLRGRVSGRARRFAGRNRPESDHDDRPVLPARVTAVGALAAAVLFAALAGGVQGEVRYLRLVIAITVALAVLNALGVMLPGAIAGRALGVDTGLRLAPAFLIIGAFTAIVSRVDGIQPPLIIGIVIATAFSTGAPRRGLGLVALAELVAITLLGFGAWLGHSAIGPVTGFGPALASETLATLCIAALGSVALLVLPIGRMPGRTVFEWSKPAWLACALAACTLAAVVIAQAPSFPVVWVAGASAIFAVGCLATWVWVRHVEPVFGRDEGGRA